MNRTAMIKKRIAALNTGIDRWKDVREWMLENGLTVCRDTSVAQCDRVIADFEKRKEEYERAL